jgi:SHS2 domain-containing protein
VTALDHAADVGLEVTAPTLAQLFRRSALGLTWLLLEREPGGRAEVRKLHVRGQSAALALRELLRELLWWQEIEGAAVAEIDNVRVETSDVRVEVDAEVALAWEAEPPVREIKGVTLHGLIAEQRGEGWYARVIFDV